jgi:hypothetical protein
MRNKFLKAQTFVCEPISGFKLGLRFLTLTLFRDFLKRLSPKGKQNRLSNSYRCGRHKFRFRTADCSRQNATGRLQPADGRPTEFVQNFNKKN